MLVLNPIRGNPYLHIFSCMFRNIIYFMFKDGGKLYALVTIQNFILYFRTQNKENTFNCPWPECFKVFVGWTWAWFLARIC